MVFPVIFEAMGFRAHAHFVLELAAWAVGFNTYRFRRSRSLLTGAQAAFVVLGAAIGGFCGARFLGAIAGAPEIGFAGALWRGDKTIVGGLLGGIAGVELAKACSRVKARTGDEVLLPLALGLAVGRIGCFLSGLSDRTHGLPTDLPWGVDLGDGIPRHPVQLYEAVFVLVALALLWRRKRARPFAQGDLFRGFLVLYFAFRFAVDFLKPFPTAPLGITAIQMACVAGVAFYASAARRLLA